MREAAEAYCRVIEAARGADRGRFVADVARTLAEALAAGYRLPDVELESDTADVESIPHERWRDVFTDIGDVLGPWDDLWTTTAVYRVDAATGLPDLTTLPPADFTVNLSLADALADVWRDLRAGLDALDRGVPGGDVTWEWGFGLRVHWGAHAVEALRALHAQLPR